MTSQTSLSSALEQQIERGIALLKQGRLVAYPTDTVYGLGANASLPRAVARVYRVKERSPDKALPLLVANPSQIAGLAESVPLLAQRLIARFMPGALTIVLTKSSAVPDTMTAGGSTIAVRIPKHPVPIALIKGLGAPIIGTSANLSGRPSPLTADEVRSQLDDRIDLIIDGGRCPGGKESTIIDLTGREPLLLREGAITREELEAVCGPIKLREEGNN